MELTAQRGKGDRGKRTSDCSQTWDLCSIAEFQPRETGRDPSSPIVLMYRSQVCRYTATLKTCTSRLVLCAIYVMVAGSAVPSTLHEFASLRWKAASISLYIQLAKGIMSVQQTKPVPHHCQATVLAVMVSSIPLTELPMGDPRKVASSRLTTPKSG